VDSGAPARVIEESREARATIDRKIQAADDARVKRLEQRIKALEGVLQAGVQTDPLEEQLKDARERLAEVERHTRRKADPSRVNASQSFNTDVHGLADLEFDVIERRRVVDIDDTTAFQIRIKNVGTKEATQILVKAWYSPNIKPLETSNGTDDRTEAKFNASKQLIAFPAIDRLAPGKEVVLGIKVQAVDQGQAKCKVSLMHDDMNEKESLEGMASFKITARR
jgi:hypothetical protein